jgi:hypothetical protein
VGRPETLLRFGLVSKTEPRFTTPDYFGGVADMSGFGDLAIGLKQRLGLTPGAFDVLLVLSPSVPTGAKALSRHDCDPDAQLP